MRLEQLLCRGVGLSPNLGGLGTWQVPICNTFDSALRNQRALGRKFNPHHPMDLEDLNVPDEADGPWVMEDLL